MPNSLCHFEFMSNQPEESKAFYGAVFDWKFDDASMPGYTLIDPGAEPGGGLFKKPTDAPGPALNVYFQVEDLDATIAKATQNGGMVIVPKTEIPNVGWFAMFADPEGIVIGLLKQND